MPSIAHTAPCRHSCQAVHNPHFQSVEKTVDQATQAERYRSAAPYSLASARRASIARQECTVTQRGPPTGSSRGRQAAAGTPGRRGGHCRGPGRGSDPAVVCGYEPSYKEALNALRPCHGPVGQAHQKVSRLVPGMQSVGSLAAPGVARQDRVYPAPALCMPSLTISCSCKVHSKQELLLVKCVSSAERHTQSSSLQAWRVQVLAGCWITLFQAYFKTSSG